MFVKFSHLFAKLLSMNLWPLRLFIPIDQRGGAWQQVALLRSSSVFRRARFDVYLPTKTCDRLIICCGQMHTVLSKRGMWWWTAWRIARIQARLFTYYVAFFQSCAVRSFGLEGLTHNVGQEQFFHVQYRDHSFVTEVERVGLVAGNLAAARTILQRLARDWNTALQESLPLPEVARRAELVSGSRLLAAGMPAVTFYPVESRVAHGAVWEKIQALERQIKLAENVPAFIRARSKGFKELTREEYDATMCHQKLQHTFAKTLEGSGERERASLLIALEQVHTNHIAVFTMGQAHRRMYLRLAPKILATENIGFVFITPPELWWWGFVVRWVMAVLVLGVSFVFLFVTR